MKVVKKSNWYMLFDNGYQISKQLQQGEPKYMAWRPSGGEGKIFVGITSNFEDAKKLCLDDIRGNYESI